MLAVDDILDDAHWVNVQDPIKQMFLSITKALRVQASSIRELDRKCSDFVTKDFVRHQVHTVEDSVCSKQDATQIIYQMQNKVDQKDYYATLQTRYDQVGFLLNAYFLSSLNHLNTRSLIHRLSNMQIVSNQPFTTKHWKFNHYLPILLNWKKKLMC